MSFNRFAACASLMVLGLGIRATPADSTLESSQSAFERWVTLQESIATEKSEWGVEQEYLNEEIRLLKEEIEALTEKRNQLSEETATIESELNALDERNEELKSAAGLVESKLPEYENKVRELNRKLPVPLQSTIGTLVNRLPEDSGASNAGASGRMLVVLGFLSQVDKANGEIVVETENQLDDSGARVQVRVLYLGLSQAWFVSQGGTIAGYGHPGEDGWNWIKDNSLASTISRAIEIHEGTSVASYVDLPVNIE